MRYRYFFGSFTRATSKSFLAIISQYLACIFLPRSKRFVVSQFKKASLSITRQKLEEIWSWWPLLRAEVLSEHMSTDYIELTFKNGSLFQILTLSSSSRGQRATGGLIEEAVLIDGTTLAEVIIPMMNIPRPLSGGGVNPEEPHSQQVYITSAGSKNTFAYERLIELTILSVIDPEDYFICGAGYELPLRYGLFDKKTIQDQKMSSTFSSDSFARESMSIWTGSSKDSWFNIERLIKSRSLLSAELEGKVLTEGFYEISADIARTGYNDSCFMVIKVVPQANAWKKKVVYTENLHQVDFADQAIRLKQLAKLYHPREIIIDGNGIGTGVVEALVSQQWDKKGQYWAPLYVSNDPDNYPYPKDEKDRAIVYNFKANAALNNDIYSNLFIQINNGHVQLLANERIVKEKLLATKKGQKMSYLAKEKFLLPYVMTSRLIDELNNLKLKPTGVQGQIAVEQISKRINKDRVSALGYGLYRIKYYEDEEFRRKKRSLFGGKSMAFFSPSTDRRKKR